MRARTPRLSLPSALALALGMLTACGTGKPIHYYQLELPPAPPAASDPYPVSLLIGRFLAPALYRDTRLIYRTGPTQMGLYEYQRWAEPPAQMVETMLIRSLRASGRFRGIQRVSTNAHGDYILRGRLHNFEEVSAGAITARVSFEVELYDPQNGATVWSHFYQQEEPVAGKDVPAVVEALNRNVQRGIGEIVGGLEQFFASHAPPTPPKSTP